MTKFLVLGKQGTRTMVFLSRYNHTRAESAMKKIGGYYWAGLRYLCEMLNASFGSWNWQALIPRLIVALVILLQLLLVGARRWMEPYPHSLVLEQQCKKAYKQGGVHRWCQCRIHIMDSYYVAKTHGASALHGENFVQTWATKSHHSIVEIARSDVVIPPWTRTRRVPLQLLWLCQ